MKYTRPVPPDLTWRLDRVQFGELVARPRDGAPGPDGLPYAAWRLAGVGLVDVLFNAYVAFLDGQPLPEGFNNCLLVFIPKGDDIHDKNIVARTPALTRPISLSDSASKFFALAVNYPLAQAAQVTVHPRQRGIVAGRSITDNILEIEGFGQSYAIAEADDPAILLFDLKAALPSLAHQWLFVTLRRMKVPGFLIESIKALYKDGFAEVMLMGTRWGRFPILSGIRQGCPASGTLFGLAIDPCIRYMMDKLGPQKGVITAYADDIAAAVRELYHSIEILDKAFATIARCSSLELHPGKVVIIPLWKFDIEEVRAGIAAVAPRLAAAAIQGYGKLLGIHIGPQAAKRQWSNLREVLRARARYLASLNLAWSGVMPLFRSHVYPVAGHIASMAPIPPKVYSTEASCIAIILKTPSRAIPGPVLMQAKSFGFEMHLPDLSILGRAASFRVATLSAVLPAILKELDRARRARALNISPFLRTWVSKGVVGHLNDTANEFALHFSGLPPVGRGLQAWATKEIRSQLSPEVADRAILKRLSTVLGRPASLEEAVLARNRMHALKLLFPPVVLASVLRSVCNAWTTTGRFSGPTLPCPFGCQRRAGDRWSHFPGCPAIRRMWQETCPRFVNIFQRMTLENLLLISPDMPNEVVAQIALWTDVVGHASNDIRYMGISAFRVSREWEGCSQLVSGSWLYSRIRPGP